MEDAISNTDRYIDSFYAEKHVYTCTYPKLCNQGRKKKHQVITIFSVFTGRIYKNAIIKQHCQQVYLILSIYSTNMPCFKSQTTHSVILGFDLYPTELGHFFLSLNNKMYCYVLGIHQISTTFVIHGVQM